jgi:non-ribosomal peptide synthetase component F
LTPRPRLKEYVTWFRATDHTASISFWTNYLDGSHNCELPARPAEQADSEYIRCRFVLEPVIARRLPAVARRLSVTPNALFAAAWGATLAANCGQPDVMFGIVSANRGVGPATEDMIGPLATIAPFRTVVRPGEAPHSGARRVFEDLMRVWPHAYLGLGRILRTRRGESWFAPFNTVLAYENYSTVPLAECCPPGLSARIDEWFERADFDLVVGVHPDHQFNIEFSCRTSWGSDEYLRKLFSALSAALIDLIDAADAPEAVQPGSQLCREH